MMPRQGAATLARGRRGILLWAACSLCACGAADQDRGDAPVSDGIPTWRLSGQPRVSIGGADGELHQVYTGFVVANGGIVLGNSGTAELRFFDRTGRHVATAGREGSGPGEFRSISWLGRLPGDSILVFDARMRRFSVLDGAGRHARSFSETGPFPLRPLGLLPDRELFAAAEQQYDPRGQPGLVRDTMVLLRLDSAANVVDTVGTFPGSEWLLYRHPASFRSTQLPFGRSGLVTLSDSLIFYASSESALVTVYSVTGQVVRRIPVPARQRVLTDAEAVSYLREIGDAAERSAVRDFFRRERGVRHVPLITALQTDRSGNLWVQLAPRPGEHATWIVFSKAGEQLGTLRIPASWQPLDIQSDVMLVREINPDGVEAVSLRDLLR